MQETVNHTFEPVYDKTSRILILGTMPSPKSRENGFYYSHPQNRFWRVISQVLGASAPQTNEQKKQLLLVNHIALWDVLASCTIMGADDSSIKNPIVNDICIILNDAPIQAIFTTGRKATELYKKYCLPATRRESFYLPSTSPANCASGTYLQLVAAYEGILPYLLTQDESRIKL